jgi:BirA family biotin operon repressor/biotin-[acetyl-CoA-carboxylase] ligase
MTDNPSLPDGYRAVILDEVDSTNEEAKRSAEAGEKGGLFILARAQTAGRGRRGRQWVSAKGNLYTTLLLRPETSAARAAELSFVAANAAAETLEVLGAGQPLVKWPNDVLLGGSKIAGILLESSSGPDGGLAWLAVGFGLNLAHAPKDTPYPATALAWHTGRAAPDPADVLPVLAQAWAGQYETWKRRGFAPVREAWLARAAGLGGPIIARLEGHELEGRFAGLDETGALLLETDTGAHRITAGEVFFGPMNE